MAMAMAADAVPDSGKTFTIGAGAAHYEGETAFAVGMGANVFDRVNLSADAAYAQESARSALMLTATVAATNTIAVKATGSYADDKMGLAAGVSVSVLTHKLTTLPRRGLPMPGLGRRAERFAALLFGGMLAGWPITPPPALPRARASTLEGGRCP